MVDIKIQLESLMQEAKFHDGTFKVESIQGENFRKFINKCKKLLSLLKDSYPSKFDGLEMNEDFSIGNHPTKGDYYSNTKIKELLITLDSCLKINDTLSVKNVTPSETPLSILQKIAQNFPKAVRQLKNRRNNKQCFEIADEYDVQDIFECFLYLFFDDIRKENSSPEFAGSNSKIDFILPKEKIGIEIKNTRKGLDAKKLGEELIIDKTRYKKHPDCNFLFCFVYDIEHRIKNPVGLENDLSETEDLDFGVTVKIFPK